MNMDEYLQKKNMENKKTTQDRLKELQDAERRAKEIRQTLKVEKKKEFEEKIHNFHIFGMGFRPWTLNDMVIFLVIGIIIVGALSFVPGKEISSDANNEGSFFTKLFGGFTVKSVENENLNTNETANLDASEETRIPEPVPENTGSSDDGSAAGENVDLTDYGFEVNDNLKDDKSTVTIEKDKSFDIKLREMKADAVDTLSRVKVVITCWDGINENTKNEKLQKLKFYFS